MTRLPIVARKLTANAKRVFNSHGVRWPLAVLNRDRMNVAEKVSDPDGRDGPPGASQNWGQTPFPKTQVLASHGIHSTLVQGFNRTATSSLSLRANAVRFE